MSHPGFSSPSVSGSNFGPNAKLHIGDYNVHVQDKPILDQSNPSADEQFLSDLSSIHPENQWSSVKRPNVQTAQEGFRTWSAKARFDDWFLNSDGKYLWIQDETLSQEGGSLLISDIIESLQEQNRLDKNTQNSDRASHEKTSGLAYFYCSCPLYGHEQQWTPSHVLGGLIYVLLQSRDRSALLQTTRQAYGRRLKASSVDRTRFQLLVEILLNILRSASLSSLPRVTLIVEAIDQCGADAQDIGVADLLDAMKQCVEQAPNLKWVISSRTTFGSSEILAGLESDFHILELSYTDVGKGLGLLSMTKTVLAVGAMMQRMYQDSKRHVERDPDGYRWFQYSEAGGNWLKGPQQQSDGSSGASVVWYERNTTLGCEPSPLALHIADVVCPRVGLQLDVVYYGCHSALNTNFNSSDKFRGTFKAQPAVVLFCMLSQMIYGAHCSGYGWAKVVVDLPRRLRKILESLTSSMAKARQEIYARMGHLENAVTAEDGADLDESLQGLAIDFPLGIDFHLASETGPSARTEGWHTGLDVRDHYAPVIVDLIASVASRTPNDTLLIFDSLEHMNWAIWKRTLQVLRDRTSGRVRILLCGNSQAVDKICAETAMPKSEGWRKFVGLQLDEHSEYKECLQSLHFDTIHTRRDSVTDAWPNTNKWLWNNEAFQDWVASGGVLWIRGKAGSGKSVLAKTILKNLAERLGSNCEQVSPWFVCDWFYNARGTEIGKSHSSMLRSLAYEILRYDEQAYQCAKSHYRALDLGAKRPTWSLSVLTFLLRDLAASPSTPQTVTIVDALDESENGAEGTPENRLSIVRSLCEIAGQSRGQMRVIILGRPDPLIASHLKHCHHINMQEHNQIDIEALVDSGLDNIREAWASVCGFSNMEQPCATGSSESLQNETHSGLYYKSMPCPAGGRELLSNCRLPTPIRLLDEQEQELREIRRYLITNASGVVLWVCLVLHELRDCVNSTEKAFTLKDLTEILYGLPSDLDDLYARMTLGLNPTQDSQKTTTTKNILMWIIGSAPWGPLTLKYLWEALALPEERTLDSEWTRGAISRGRFEIGQNWDRFCQIIHQYCGPLVEIRRDHNTDVKFDSEVQSNKLDLRRTEPALHAEAKDTWTVHLLHQTTKTFLGNKDRSGQLYVNSDLASIYILDTCYLYLGLKPPQPDGLVFKNDLRKPKSPSTSTSPLVQSDAKAIREYARDRPLFDFAVRVVEEHLPFQRFSIMESMQGGDGSHDFGDCIVAYCILDAFQPGRVTISEAYDIRSFFCQCCLRGGADMLETIFDLVQKYQSPGSIPQISGLCAYEILRGAVEALRRLETSSLPRVQCLWHPTLQKLLECYSRHAMAVDTSSTAAVCSLSYLDEPIDTGLDFLEDLQRRSQECPAHPSHEHGSPMDRIIKIHGESVKVSMGHVYESISQVLTWLDLIFVSISQNDLNDNDIYKPPWVLGSTFMEETNRSLTTIDSCLARISGLSLHRDLALPRFERIVPDFLLGFNLEETLPQNFAVNDTLQDLDGTLEEVDFYFKT